MANNHRTTPYSPSSVTSLPSSSMGSFDVDSHTQPPRNLPATSARATGSLQDNVYSTDNSLTTGPLANTREAAASAKPSSESSAAALASTETVAENAQLSAHATNGGNETDEELEIEASDDDDDDDDDDDEDDIHEVLDIDRELSTSIPEEEGEDSASSVATDSWPSSRLSRRPASAEPDQRQVLKSHGNLE